MVIGLLTLELHFPGAQSLKDKRQALRSFEQRTRNRHNVALAEVDGQDLWQRATIAVVSVNTDQAHLERTLTAVAGDAANARELLLVDQHMEWL
jgi:uncharacterized protein YlxP (DUF503 family)